MVIFLLCAMFTFIDVCFLMLHRSHLDRIKKITQRQDALTDAVAELKAECADLVERLRR